MEIINISDDESVIDITDDVDVPPPQQQRIEQWARHQSEKTTPTGWPVRRNGTPLPLLPRRWYREPNSVLITNINPSRIKLVISGRPIVKTRPRFSRHGVYNPHEQMEQDLRVAVARLTFLYNGESVHHFPPRVSLSMYVIFHFTNQAAFAKPDVDNLLKHVMDSLQGSVYPNDGTIVRVVAEKKLSNSQHTSVAIYRNTP